jgi:hypothetical protein
VDVVGEESIVPGKRYPKGQRNGVFSNRSDERQNVEKWREVWEEVCVMSID